MRKLFKGILWTLGVLAVLLGLARGLLLRWWQVPDNDPVLEASIAPSLRAGDTVILWRATSPSFGDLVICPEPGAEDRIVIGRIIGEAGDDVEIDGHNVRVNGSKVETETSCNPRQFTVAHPTTGAEVEQFCQMEAVGGKTHMRGTIAGDTPRTQTSKRKVGEGKVFLVSDNRMFPYDSRQFGSVDRNTCTETIVFRLWSKKGFFDVENRFDFVR